MHISVAKVAGRNNFDGTPADFMIIIISNNFCRAAAHVFNEYTLLQHMKCSCKLCCDK